MELNNDQKTAYNSVTLKHAQDWNNTDEQTAFICDTFGLRIRELDATINDDGLIFQDWIEGRFERLLKAQATGSESDRA